MTEEEKQKKISELEKLLKEARENRDSLQNALCTQISKVATLRAELNELGYTPKIKGL